MLHLTSTSAVLLLLFAPSARAQSMTWTQVGASGVYTFATSPDYANDGLVWYVPSTVNYAGDGDIHLATDYGNAVQALSALPGGPHLAEALAISPTFAADATIFATSYKNLVPNSSLWKSTDAGATWTEMPQPAAVNWQGNFHTVALSPAFDVDQTILATSHGIGDPTERSTDGGTSWSLIQPIAWQLKEIKFAEDFATSGFAYGYKWTGSPRFFRSSNFGASWSECSHPLSNPGLCAALDRTWGIAVAPVGPQGQRTIYYHGKGSVFAPENFMRSTDNGDNWEYVGAGLDGLQVYDLDIASDGRIYAATDSGVYYSDDLGTSFSQLVAAGLPNPVTKIELAGGPGGDVYALAGGVPDPTYFEIITPGATQPGNLYRLRLSELGDTVCTSLPNQTGMIGAIRAFGSAQVAANDFTLEAFQLPTSQFGIFLVSRDLAAVPISLPSNGLLCLSGTIGRFNLPGQILATGAGGTFDLTLDLQAVPQGSTVATIAAGETWHFQAWHRELMGAGNNFTNALRVTFQ